MSKRRTRAQKIAADTKRIENFLPNIGSTGPTLPYKEIRQDLTRSVIVTILALILQLALKRYL